MATAFDVHAASLADYLAWLNSSSDPNDPNSISTPVFTWQGTDYACNFSHSQYRDLQPGGFVPMDDLTLEVLEPLPEPGPQSEQTITFKERVYRIRTVKTAAGKNPQLVCYDPARGA